MSLKDLKQSVGNALYRQLGRANGHIQNTRSLPVDVLEDDSSYLVVFDAPGTEPDDVQVRYLEGRVKIRLDRFRQFRDRFEMRFPGRGMTLDGEAELPADAAVDPDAGTARLSETGTLRIEIPKETAIDDGEVDLEHAGEKNGPSDDGNDRESPDTEATSGSNPGEVAVDD
ncbi:Hsp20/alpha crystallin family protein [Natrarchaeobaculum sulfurireducens]|uniref:Hsp20 type chaperone n=1 Tax=Natrarchaeobaculum sulfurireducens TaxID=2044521 RepID=A0A346PI01_9EURY|nr:Hsp20/alpha crystallin family protein [Natrarchaeobaculum sulfurireducens]AXR79146.1 Molecular chaperone (HSP20 family) [Natrarchaeobaculum sulfurireducens]AXR80945.1 hsp20 type chaperone [Natrarchaeobaculum sulfurireducens]